MSNFKVELSDQAKKQLRKLPYKQTEKILRKLFHELTLSPFPKGKNPKKLKGVEAFRYRVGSYRIMYTIAEKQILVSHIAHRKDAYKDL